MSDFTYPSVFFAYFLFVLLAGGALFFFLRSLKDGYLGHDSEAPKFRMLNDANEEEKSLSAGAGAPRRTP